MKNMIDYNLLLKNVEEMINLLEYDAMRSPGKTKMNSQHLHSLFEMQKRYEKELASVNKKSAKAQDDSSTRTKAEAVASPKTQVADA